MKYREIDTGYETPLLLPYIDESQYFCPICGDSHLDQPVYMSNDRPDYEYHCLDCNFYAGSDEGSCREWGLTYSDYLMSLRGRWLDKAGWTPEHLDRLNTVMGIEESEIRAVAEKLRVELGKFKKMPPRPE